MKDLIITALNDTMDSVNKKTSILTKKITKSVSIMDVKPLDIPKFMKDNNIPDDAEFDGRDNGYDAWDDILLSWEVEVPTTDAERINLKGESFNLRSSTRISKLLTANGYKRVGFDSSLLKYFTDTTVYDMYIDKDYDRLVEYYSMSFVKII